LFRFLTSEEKAGVIREYGQRYGVMHFVETGTSVGTTVSELLRDFTTIITIELDDGLWRAAANRFEPYDHVACLHGDSGELLSRIPIAHCSPVLFWLDGHYSGPGTARGEVDTPVVRELEAAVNAPPGSVILIDDARLFGGMEEHTEEFKDYPHIEWIENLALTHGYAYSLEEDIIRLTPNV
jgi:hypothetical protein